MDRRSFLAAALLTTAAGAESPRVENKTNQEQLGTPKDVNAENHRIAELNSFWRELARAVNEGDFDAYKASCHESGVLVKGEKKTTERLSDALGRWKPGFLDTKEGRMKAQVEIRLSQRWGEATTAYETAIFRYSTETPGGQRNDELVHFEALLIKADRWKTLMEYQKGPATSVEWQQLQAIPA